MARVDQKARRTRSPTRSRVDEENLARLRAIVEEYGWPGRSLVGEDGADAAWLLLQHADSVEAIEFRRTCLQLLERALESGDVDPRHFAYVSDRVAVFEGVHLHGVPGLQRFGTQVGSYTKDDGTKIEFLVYPAVEESRKAFLLPPRAEIDFRSRPYPIPYGAARNLEAWRWPPLPAE